MRPLKILLIRQLIRLAGEEESDAIRQEIDLVIKDKVPTIALKLRVKDQPWFEPFLEQKLTSMPHRTYLWLHLIVEAIILRQDHLSAGVTKKNLEAVVNSIPGTVDDAYTTILEKSPNKLLAKKLLHIVVAAKRPLTLGEMNIAMNVGDESRSYYDLGLESEDRFKITIRNLCGLFVSVIESKIYLLHQTAKEFLITKSNAATSHTDVQPQLGFWKHSLEPGKSNSILAEACISYLLFSVFEEAPLIVYKENEEDENEEDERVMRYCEEHKFLRYSSLYWVTHFREAVCIDDEALPNMALDICGTGTKRLQTWLMVFQGSQYSSGYFRMTDLTVTSRFGLVLLVQLLLDKGADLSNTAEQGWTALHWAAQEGHEPVTRLLLDREADVSATDEQGWTALHWAADRGHKPVTRLLLDRGANVSATNKHGWTALHFAASRDREPVTRLLLDRGANVSATNEHGWTALHWAVDRGHKPVTRLLLDRGANVSATNEHGWTALHFAAMGGRKSLTRLLLNKGAKPSATTISGETALNTARKRKFEWDNRSDYDAVIQLLEPITKPTATTADFSCSLIASSSSSQSLKILAGRE